MQQNISVQDVTKYNFDTYKYFIGTYQPVFMNCFQLLTMSATIPYLTILHNILCKIGFNLNELEKKL